jgi:hypothetical protein
MNLTFTHKTLSWLTDYPTQTATAQGLGTSGCEKTQNEGL